MAKDLIVGSAGLQDFEGSIISFLSSRGLEAGLATWLEGPDTIATISCLNGAAVMEFLRHAVQLEGYADEDAGFAAGLVESYRGRTFHGGTTLSGGRWDSMILVGSPIKSRMTRCRARCPSAFSARSGIQ